MGLYSPPNAQEGAPQVMGRTPPDTEPMTIPDAVNMLMALISAQQGQLSQDDQQALGLFGKFMQTQAEQFGSGQPGQMGDQPPGMGNPPQQDGGPMSGGNQNATSDYMSHTGSPNMNFIGLQ